MPDTALPTIDEIIETMGTSAPLPPPPPIIDANLPPQPDPPVPEELTTEQCDAELAKQRRAKRAAAEAERNRLITIGHNLLKNTALDHLVQRSPSNPLTAEYIRRHIQSTNVKYESPQKLPSTARAWYLYLSVYAPNTAPTLSISQLVVTLINVSRRFNFHFLPNPNDSYNPYNHSNSLYSPIYTNPWITFQTRIPVQSLTAEFQAEGTIQMSDPIRTRPHKTSATLHNVECILTSEPTFSGLLAGIYPNTTTFIQLEPYKAQVLYHINYLLHYYVSLISKMPMDEVIRFIANKRSNFIPPLNDTHQGDDSTPINFCRLAWELPLPALTIDQLVFENVDKPTLNPHFAETRSFYPRLVPLTTTQFDNTINHPTNEADADDADDDDDNL